MKQGQIIALFGEGIVGKSRVVTTQRRLNCYFEARHDGDKTKIAVYGTPGLQAAFQLTTPLNSPVRGFLGTQDALYACAYNEFQQVSPTDGSLIGSGTLETQNGHCEMAANASQVVIVDGSAGYLWTENAFSTLESPFPAGANTVTNVSEFFLVESPGTQQFYQSNAGDGSSWNALQVASASAYQDLIVAVDNLDGNAVIFSQLHTEYWQDVGTSPVAFQPILSAVSEYGLAAIASRAHLNDSICFLAQNREGQVQVCRAQGFVVRPISIPDLDYIINQFSTVSDATALVYGTDAHKFYQLTFPTANRSFLFDALTELWSEVQTGVSQAPTRHQALYSALSAGQMYLSDYESNQIYTMNPNVYTDNGVTIQRELITRHVLSNFDRLWPAQLYLDMETGVGLQSGQGSSPQVMLQYSKDNGRTWSAERWKGIGAVGKYRARAVWRRFGCTRDAAWRIRMTDPVKFVITEGAAKLRVRR